MDLDHEVPLGGLEAGLEDVGGRGGKGVGGEKHGIVGGSGVAGDELGGRQERGGGDGQAGSVGAVGHGILLFAGDGAAVILDARAGNRKVPGNGATGNVDLNEHRHGPSRTS